jgi:hypothetical protein
MGILPAIIKTQILLDFSAATNVGSSHDRRDRNQQACLYFCVVAIYGATSRQNATVQDLYARFKLRARRVSSFLLDNAWY